MRFVRIFGILFMLIFCRPLTAQTGDRAVVEIELNGVNKGEFVIHITGEPDFLIAHADLTAIGIQDPRGTEIRIDERVYLSLKSMPKIKFEFDEARLLLKIDADPALLGKTYIDFIPTRRFDVIKPRGSSMFFNYGFRHSRSQELGTSTFTATQETGVRWGDFLMVSNSTITRSENETRAARLMTNITRDDRSSLVRLVLGDTYATSGMLGSTLLMGGISYSKSYTLEPSFLKRPTLDYEGFAALPSQVDILVDGVKIRSETISPGGFDLKNIPVDAGLHGLEVRIRDSLGREQTMTLPYYSTDVLLRKGLHDYSYNAGFLRNEYGIESNNYGAFGFSASHRYGLTRDATIGVRAEGSRAIINGGPQLTARLGKFGIADVGMAVSAGRDRRKGLAASVNHTFLTRSVSIRLQAAGYSRDYRMLANLSAGNNRWEPVRYALSSGVGYSAKKLGSVSFNVSTTKKYTGEKRDSYAATYARNLLGSLSLSTTFQRVHESRPDNQVFVSLTFFLPRHTTVSSSYRRENNADAQTVQVHQNPPTGQGFSYRAILERSRHDATTYSSIQPYVQYNGKYGVYSAEYRRPLSGNSSTTDLLEFSASGSVVNASGVWGASRPIDDSFAIVQAGNIESVRVYFNNHEIERTNAAGKVILPSLNSYVDNIIGINDQDVPVDYVLKDVTRHLSPSWRSGTLVKFQATKVQAFSGMLRLRTRDGEQPVEFVELSIMVNGEKLDHYTARDGEFYLENIPPGEYSANFVFEQRPYAFTLKIPKSDEMIVYLGQVTVEQTD